MGRFDRNNRSGGRDSGRRTEMHSAICDKCGRECKVPFKPSSDKPIYCSECFEKQGGGRDDRRDSGRDSGRRNFSDSRDRGDREMFSAICDDCGNECKVPFKPSSNKPIYCSSCFEKRENSHDGDSKGKNFNGNSEQLDLIISKLDMIISALETKKEPVVKKEIKKKVEKKEPVKKEIKKKTVKKAKKE